MRPYLAIQLATVFIAHVSGETINVCELQIDRRQKLNVSCNFDTKEGCTTLFTSQQENYWKYQTQHVGSEEDGEITDDHNTVVGRSGGYYLFNSFNVVPQGYKDQLLTPFIAYNNICLRFWYILPNIKSNIKVLSNGKEFFCREGFTRRWEQKSINISFQTSAPIQIAFESHTTTNNYSYVGIDDVVIEIERPTSISTLSTTTISTTLQTLLRTASAVLNSNRKETPITTTSSTATSSTSSMTSAPTIASKLNTKASTPINPPTSKTTTTALKTTSTTTATDNTISTPKLTATPIKTPTTATSVANTSIITTKTPTETPRTKAAITQTSMKSISPTTTISTTLVGNSTLSSTTTSTGDSIFTATPRTVFLTSSSLTTISNAVKLTRKTPNQISIKEIASTEENTVHVRDISITISYERISTGPKRITEFSPSGSYGKLTITTTNPALFHSEGSIDHRNSEGDLSKHRGITDSSIVKDNLIIIVMSALAGVVVLLVILFVVLKLKHRANSTASITDDININKLNMSCKFVSHKTLTQMESL